MLIEKIINNPIGKKFNRLTVISIEPTKNGHKMCKCICDCGNFKTCRITALLSNNTLSCRCLNSELLAKLQKANAIPGLKDENGKNSTEYYSFAAMKGRCYNPQNKKYKNYGQRGIRVCDRWKNSFSNFLSDMGKKPSKDYTIERIDNNGNYEPSNCRWATKEDQAKNKTNTVRLIVNGNEIHQAGLASILNVDPKTIEGLRKKGKNGDQIFNQLKTQ